MCHTTTKMSTFTNMFSSLLYKMDLFELIEHINTSENAIQFLRDRGILRSEPLICTLAIINRNVKISALISYTLIGHCTTLFVCWPTLHSKHRNGTWANFGFLGWHMCHSKCKNGLCANLNGGFWIFRLAHVPSKCRMEDVPT